MRGNQAILNNQIFEHPDNPVKESIDKIDPMDILFVITDEYWKEWKRQLVNSTSPHIYAPGLGTYSLRYGKSKSFLRKMVNKIRGFRIKYKDTYLIPDTRAYSIHQHYLKKFRILWKQVDEIKKQVNYNNEIWKQKKIKKYGDKAIL